jgi:predicted phosphodiesterase
MRIADIGALEGAVLVFGGPYSNLAATRALIAEAKARGIPPQRCICTGDTVAYCAEPAETVAALRDFGCHVVAGNCEQQLAAGALDCGCGFEDGTVCDRLSAAWYAHAGARVGPEDRAWMGGLPDLLLFTQGAARYAVLHGGARDVARFIWPVSPEAVFEEEFAALEALVGPVDAVLAGHSGIAFERRVGARRWINAGVIGMPPHDGAPQTRFAVLGQGRAEIHRLSYYHSAAARAMRATGLTQGYDAALGSGYWPSEDVLPEALRQERQPDPC